MPVCRGCRHLQPDGSCALGLNQRVSVCPRYEPQRKVAVAGKARPSGDGPCLLAQNRYTAAHMVVRMRSTKGHTGNRRSHHALTEARLSKCECGALYVRHRACPTCGKYRGKQAIDIVAKKERETRRAKKREQELKASGMQKADATPEEEKKGEKQEK